jgi:4-oxalocrotonate tautomerase
MPPANKSRATSRGLNASRRGKETVMPLINVKLIEGVFNESQKKQMVTKLTDAMVAIEGEAMRQVTWVVIDEVKSGHWALGGKPLTTADVRAMQASKAA